jgi:hypothetical protein
MSKPRVGVNATVTQEWPCLSNFFAVAQVNVSLQQAVFACISPRQYFTLWSTDKAIAPELSAFGPASRVRFMTMAISGQ